MCVERHRPRPYRGAEGSEADHFRQDWGDARGSPEGSIWNTSWMQPWFAAAAGAWCWCLVLVLVLMLGGGTTAGQD